jgi:pre-rRNA-processing protein IPI1
MHKRKDEKKDFEKRKQKIGKKKLAPESSTNTSFTTRSIHMSDQGLAQAEGAVVNERGQTLQDLLGKIGHPSGSVRKEAVLGLRSLFDMHPDLLAHPVTLLSLFDRIAECMSDKERSVRHALLALLEAVLSRVPESRMTPFFQLLMVHTSSAMTSMDSGVRLDSLDFLDIWIARCPSLSIRYGAGVLANFLRLISTEYKTAQAGLSGKAGQMTKALLVR